MAVDDRYFMSQFFKVKMSIEHFDSIDLFPVNLIALGYEQLLVEPHQSESWRQSIQIAPRRSPTRYDTGSSTRLER